MRMKKNKACSEPHFLIYRESRAILCNISFFGLLLLPTMTAAVKYYPSHQPRGISIASINSEAFSPELPFVLILPHPPSFHLASWELNVPRLITF